MVSAKGQRFRAASRAEATIPTIHEVARLSRVSVATVSRVFNGYPDVSKETRERVLATARELDYAPSAAARTLVTQRSQLIGVILFTEAARDMDAPQSITAVIATESRIHRHAGGQTEARWPQGRSGTSCTQR